MKYLLSFLQIFFELRKQVPESMIPCLSSRLTSDNKIHTETGSDQSVRNSVTESRKGCVTLVYRLLGFLRRNEPYHVPDPRP